MVLGAPFESRWVRAEPRRDAALPLLERILHTALPRARILHVEALGGLRNANFKIQLDGEPESVVVRIYEHDASVCRKELDLLRAIGTRVPVPEVIHAEPNGIEGVPPFAVLRFIHGITFRDLKCTGDRESICQAAYAMGQTLASIGKITFPRTGWLGPGPRVSAPLLTGENPVPRFIDLCLRSEHLAARLEDSLCRRLHDTIWQHAQELSQIDNQAHLVHGDFGKRNILVRRSAGAHPSEKWTVAAVLDWEFAVSGSPLMDVGHILRYERTARPLLEPDFSRGFTDAGGRLPSNWRRMARLIDCVALCEALTHDALAEEFALEIVELVRAAVEDCDPCLP